MMLFGPILEPESHPGKPPVEDSKELLHCTAQFTSAELVPRAPFEGELEAVEGIYAPQRHINGYNGSRTL